LPQVLQKASLFQSPPRPHSGLPDQEMVEASPLAEGTQVNEMEC
jgi:hypothetical protein